MNMQLCMYHIMEKEHKKEYLDVMYTSYKKGMQLGTIKCYLNKALKIIKTYFSRCFFGQAVLQKFKCL